MTGLKPPAGGGGAGASNADRPENPSSELDDISGLRSITLRRLCLTILLLALAFSAIEEHDVEHVFGWYALWLVYGGLIAGAVQHVYRRVRVGRVETATMLLTTVSFVAAFLLVPRQVGRAEHTVTVLGPDPADHTSLLTGYPYVRTYVTDLFNAPLLSRLGHHRTASNQPWLTIAIVLAALAMAGICAQWALVARLGRHRAGVFDDAVTTAGLAAGATLEPPLGTSVTRPVTATRSRRRRR